MLEREKVAVLSELDATVPRGHTHKWAQAAWAQAVRHGLPHAAVRGDVQGATVADVQAYAAAHVGPSPRVRIVCVGPIPIAEVRETLEAGIGKLPAAPGLEPAAKPAAAAKPKGDLAATWDLDARHYVEWYPLPDDGPAERAAGAILATALTTALAASGETAFATADAVPGMGRLLFVSSSLAKRADPALLRKKIRAAIDGLLAPPPGMPDLATRLRMGAAEVQGLPDFAAIRKMRAGQPGIEYLEANLVLALVGVEESTGLRGAELRDAFEALTAARLESIAKSALAEANRSSLVLEPPAK
jgi:predicted Zn-dependent peptidase